MRRKVVLGLSLAAIAWSVALLVGAATLPFYSGTRVSVDCPGCPEVVSELETRTLLEVNGPGVLLVVGVPLGVSLLVAVTLWSGRPSVPAWVLIALLWLFSLVAVLSIGMFVMPAALLLTLAAAFAGKPAPRAAAASLS